MNVLSAILVEAKGIGTEKHRRQHLGPYELWDRTNFISFPTTLVQHEMSAYLRDNVDEASPRSYARFREHHYDRTEQRALMRVFPSRRIHFRHRVRVADAETLSVQNTNTHVFIKVQHQHLAS